MNRPDEPGAVPGLDALYGDRTPPPDLEARVARHFREATSPGTAGRRRALPWLGRVAAAALLFSGGWVSARAAGGDDAPPPTRLPAWALLLYEGEPSGAAADGPDRAREYATWARDRRAGGLRLLGAELGPAVRVGGDPAGPPPQAPGGFFLVDAATREEAERLAREHPHVAYGGWIEVAEVR